jgi:hypothetical protein
VQAAGAPLLVQLRDGPSRRGRAQRPAPVLPPSRARVLGVGLARGRGRRGHRGQVGARGRRSLALSCPDLAPEAGEATHFPGATAGIQLGAHFSMSLDLNDSSNHEEKGANFWREGESAMTTALVL